MPSDAFYQLEEEKRQHLLQTAIHEFSIQPYEKVSVFKIAQNAGISRSNFYYYFKDKEDIYQYLLFRTNMDFVEKLREKGENYDIFSLTRAIFHEIAAMRDSDQVEFLYRVMDNMKFEDMLHFMHQMEQCLGGSLRQALGGLDHLQIKSDRQLIGLVSLLMTSILFALPDYLKGECSLAEAEVRLEEMIRMIRFGIEKQGERED